MLDRLSWHAMRLLRAVGAILLFLSLLLLPLMFETTMCGGPLPFPAPDPTCTSRTAARWPGLFYDLTALTVGGALILLSLVLGRTPRIPADSVRLGQRGGPS